MKDKVLNIILLLVTVVLLGLMAFSGSSLDVSAVAPHFNTHPQDDATLTVRNLTEDIRFYGTDITVKPDQTVRFRIWVHNVTWPADNAVARNTKVQVRLNQSSDKKTLTANAYISADNANSVSGEAKVHTDSPQNFELISGSANMDGRDSNDQDFTSKALSNDILGSGVVIGDIKGCWEYVHQITFDVKLNKEKEQPHNPQIAIDKKVVYQGTSYDSVSGSTHKYSENEDVSYKVTLTNNGDAETKKINVKDQLPTYIKWVSGEGSYDSGANRINFSEFNLTAGASKTFSYIGKVKEGIPTGDTNQTNTTSVTTENAGSKEDQATVVVHKDAPSENVEIKLDKKVVYSGTEYDSISSGTHTYKENEEVSYKFTVTNSGNVKVKKIVPSDQLPSYIKWMSGDGSYDSGGNKVTFSEFNLNAGASKTFSYTAKVKEGIPTGDTNQTNVVTINTENAGSKQDQTTVVIHKDSPSNTEIKVDKKVVYSGTEYDSVPSSTHTYKENEEISYKFTVTNSGNVEVTKVTPSDQLPSYIKWVSGDGSYDSGSNKVTFGEFSLSSGSSRTFTYTGKVKEGIPTGDTNQTNVVTVNTENAGNKQDQSSVTIHKDGEVKAAQTVTEIPKTGSESWVLLGLLSLLPLGVRLRKVAVKRHLAGQGFTE